MVGAVDLHILSAPLWFIASGLFAIAFALLSRSR